MKTVFPSNSRKDWKEISWRLLIKWIVQSVYTVHAYQLPRSLWTLLLRLKKLGRKFYQSPINPHGYRFCGLQGPAFVSFGKILISPSLQTMGESWILSRNHKNASFREQIRKLGTWGGSGAATKLQSRANWKKTDFFLPLQALEEHNSQATSIQNLGIFFLVVYYMPNLSSK